MRAKIFKILLSLVFVGTVVIAIASALAARYFYFQAKLVRTVPVNLDAYAAANAALQGRAEVGQMRRPRIVLIGDSRIKAWDLEKTAKSWEVINRGINGETSAQLLLRFENDALNLKPDLIVVQSGINDLVAVVGDEKKQQAIINNTIENLESICKKASCSETTVVITTVIPPARPEILRRLVWSETIREGVMQVNRELQKRTMPPNAHVLDLTYILGTSSHLSESFALDTLHLNQAGYNAINTKMISKIKLILSALNQ